MSKKKAKAELDLIEPYSPEWFAVMMSVKPLHAAHAATLVEKIGSKEICMVCGDRPAPVGTLSPGPGVPVRMCKDCQEIRKGMYGETFTRSRNSP